VKPLLQMLWPLLLVLTPVSPVWSHADLELQIEELTLQLERQPENVEWLLKRGDLQRRHDKHGLARKDFKSVREIQPHNETVDWFEGRLEVESGQPEIGVSYLDRFLLVNPDHGIALQNRAQAHLLMHQPLLAAQDYQRVIKISERPSPSLYTANALALVEAGTEYFSKAMEVVSSGLERFPGEIRLTGLGTDISLAVADTNTAMSLMNTLPSPVLGLQLWQRRLVLLDCELEADPSTETCQADALESLQNQ